MKKNYNLEKELNLAKEIQKSFLPANLPDYGGFGFASYYKPAIQIGGDYYGVFPMSHNRIGVAVGDVAGKGIPAALLMAKLSSETRLALLMEPTPAEAVTKLNDSLYHHTSTTDRFITMVFGVFHPDNKVTLINAGHLAPLLIQANGNIKPICGVAGIPIGIFENFIYESFDINLMKNETLLFISDGVTDALSSKKKPFLIDGVHHALRDIRDNSPRNVVKILENATSTHAKGTTPFDDITILAVSRF